MQGNSKQVRKVIRGVFKKEQVKPGGTWSDAGKGESTYGSLLIAWHLGFKCKDILPKAQAAVLAAGYDNEVRMTQDCYLRVQAPRA